MEKSSETRKTGATYTEAITDSVAGYHPVNELSSVRYS